MIRPDALGRTATPGLPAGRAASSEGALERSLPTLLCVLFLAYVFVGTTPMADADSAVLTDGNAVERAVVFAMAGLALAVIATRARTALALVRRSWSIWLLLAWICASVGWASHPDLALRRTAVLVLIALIGLAIATGIGSLRRVHALLLAVLAATLAADLAVTLLRPGFSVTDIGVRGFHAQKNVAGLVGLVAVIAGLGWSVGARTRLQAGSGLATVAAAAAFLVLTQSKTSITLALLAALLMPAILVLRRLGAAVAGLAGLALLAVALVAGLTAAAFDTDILTLVTPGGDTSFTGRTEIWDLARAEIARRPWTGFGYGSYWDVGPEDDPLRRAHPGTWLAQLKPEGAGGFIINEAHNGYLDIRLQAGLPGLALALLVAGLTIRGLVGRCFGREPLGGDTAAAITLLLIMLVFLVHNVTESSLWIRGQILANLSILIGFLASSASRAGRGRGA